ncbi:hypothetical protein [Deinococcus multiflagellatus]|uniref:Uncharacterized protein n=1 Tax=Deinococcus multiflagellatus TaxID=1656887 RepID=A0ABW1ZET4_9DEIO|nr:hypothetical protein [Deinococcus multiflagellatus]MBZ9712179.1 hypothetical protein [Deinococcus multiflagellatus]
MSDKWFEGKKDAPEGTIAGVGKVGPGVKVRARDEAHEKAIKATGYYVTSTAPKVESAPAEAEGQTDQTLAPTPAAPEKRAKDGK